MTAPTRPVMRYYGSKWRIAPWVISHFPPHRAYVEPYGGGASVLMRKPRTHGEVYNDLNGDVVNLFRVLRDPDMAERLRAAVELTPAARAEFELARDQHPDPVEDARRLLLRAHLGIGTAGAQRKATGFRSSTARSGTTPAADWAGWPAQIPAYVERLRGVVIEQRDALAVIEQHDSPDTLFYVDPPYVGSARSESNGRRLGRYAHEMTDADHERLAELLHSVQGMVVLSGYHSPLYDRLYGAWERDETTAFADNGCHTTDGETMRRTEVLWCNPAAVEAKRRADPQLDAWAVAG